jgi:hypothetical protein
MLRFLYLFACTTLRPLFFVGEFVYVGAQCLKHSEWSINSDAQKSSLICLYLRTRTDVVAAVDETLE